MPEDLWITGNRFLSLAEMQINAELFQGWALVRRFKELAGDRAAMEVEYAAYSRAQRDALRSIADEFGLMYSCASDYHGNLEGETLAHKFDPSLCAPLLRLLGI